MYWELGIVIGAFVLLVVVSFCAGRRYEREKWALCKDCGCPLSYAEAQDVVVMCHDCRCRESNPSESQT